MFQKFILVCALLVLFAPAASKGASFEELLKQIAELQAQITTLQKQLVEIKQISPVSSGLTFLKNLSTKDRNEEVKELQKILKTEGLFCVKCQITGYFGYWTKAGLMNFQQKYKLKITGIVNEETRAKLNALAQKTSSVVSPQPAPVATNPTTPPAGPSPTPQSSPTPTTPSPAPTPTSSPSPTPTPSPTPASPSPSPSPNPTPAPQDTTPPTFTISINAGAQTTTSPDVIVQTNCTDPSGGEAFRFSHVSTFVLEPWEGAAAAKHWTLSSGDGVKTVYAQCKDEYGNTATASDTITLDAQSPSRSAIQPAGILSAGTTQVTLSAITNEQAFCRYSATAGVDYDSMRDADTMSATFTTSHSITINPAVGTQTYNIRCKDASGNKNTNDYSTTFFVQGNPPSQTTYLVKPYLVYPADKSMYTQYETAVNTYLTDLQKWYYEKVGKTFVMAPLQVVRSTYDYATMRCGPTPTTTCLNDPSKLEGNWGMYMNMAIHNGVEQWEAQTAALIFSAGGGGYAGANNSSNNTSWAISGDWALEPISGVPNTWGIPCSYSDGWQCTGGTPKGTPAHELGHAFGLPHPGEQYVNQSIMQWHGNFPSPGLLQQEITSLLASPFFK